MAFRETWIPLYSKPRKYGEWEWEQAILPRFSREPDALRLAIWSEDVLCGLAIGAPTNSLDAFVLNFVAGSPDPGHPLKGSILASATAVADEYGRGLGAQFLYIAEPPKTVIRLYQALDFEVAHDPKGRQYCRRRL